MSYEGQTYYLGYDQVGTLRTVTDTSGNIVKELTYDTFGNLLNDSNPDMKLPFGFAGCLYDPDTKLIRFGYRDYDAETGKWTAKDPIGFDGGDTNLYGYVLGDPVNFVDSTGEAVNVAAGLAGGAIAGVGVALFNGAKNGFSFSQFSSDVAVCTIAGGLMSTGVGWSIGLGMIAEAAGVGLNGVSAATSAVQ